MCLIAFALGAHPRWPLVVASNRDEYRARPTAPLATWHTAAGTPVLAGRDLQDGGTWFGVTPTCRVAMLTNLRRGLAGSGQRSRGELVTRWLDSSLDAAHFANTLNPSAYAGFNLVVGDAAAGLWHCFSNADAPALTISRIAPGIHGLSNAQLNTPWRKTVELKQALAQALGSASDAQSLEAKLFTALQNPARCPPAELPHTGVPADMELGLSSAWVDLPQYGYGTRSSAVLVAEATGDGTQVTLSEQTYGAAAPMLRIQETLRWP